MFYNLKIKSYYSFFVWYGYMNAIELFYNLLQGTHKNILPKTYIHRSFKTPTLWHDALVLLSQISVREAALCVSCWSLRVYFGPSCILMGCSSRPLVTSWVAGLSAAQRSRFVFDLFYTSLCGGAVLQPGTLIRLMCAVFDVIVLKHECWLG